MLERKTSKIREELEQTPGETRLFLEQQRPRGGKSMLCSRSNEEVDREEEWVVSIQCSGQLADHLGEYLAGLETLRWGPERGGDTPKFSQKSPMRLGFEFKQFLQTGLDPRAI